MFSTTSCCIVFTDCSVNISGPCGDHNRSFPPFISMRSAQLDIFTLSFFDYFGALRSALCAARSFLHCLSLEYFCALRYALNSHMLNMLCNNISCNVILCYIIYVMYVQLWLYKTKLESMCTCTSPISVYHLSLIAICITSGFQLQFVSTRY
jgi:hypothetical protein